MFCLFIYLFIYDCLFVEASVFQKMCRYEKTVIGAILDLAGMWVQVRVRDPQNTDVGCCRVDPYFFR